VDIKFWGVRGSIPTPGKGFIKYGGNTSCVEVNVDDQTIIFDMGSGLVNLGAHLLKNNIKKFDILVSHFHYDHTCGLPFFSPAYNKDFEFTIRAGIQSTRDRTLKVLEKQISSPSFPITVEKFLAKIEYYDFEVEKDFFLGNVRVRTTALNHPDGAVGYRIEHNKKSVCYITDHEHEIGIKNERLISFLKNTDVLIYDSTYDDKNFGDYIGWGHSTWQEATRLANECKIKKLLIFHHNPENDDSHMENIQNLCNKINENFIVAKEGMFIKVEKGV
jgi:phosphoribosyl 1,2-cyclic phosphodiesterase